MVEEGNDWDEQLNNDRLMTFAELALSTVEADGEGDGEPEPLIETERNRRRLDPTRKASTRAKFGRTREMNQYG
ncbi:unnamed protein product, partial [Mesorhabditis belari]|uniref:Uncharacterized protein n=1 Tax=Mesorhabditis belari TaxID=2138241 RepID=A0AAF3ECZ5_9BILA